MSWLAPILVIVAFPIGLLLTMLTLPGVWFILICALLAELMNPALISWWTLGICTGAAALGELIDLLASSAGAKAAGGSRAGAIGALIGSLAGALGGAPFVPPIGPIAGAVLGAAAGAFIAERRFANRDWKTSGIIAAGAAGGRIVSVIVKLIITLAVGVTLIIACML